MLLSALQLHAAFADHLFANLDIIFYAGSALPPHHWNHWTSYQCARVESGFPFYRLSARPKLPRFQLCAIGMRPIMDASAFQCPALL